jgi:hypothetical protein
LTSKDAVEAVDIVRAETDAVPDEHEVSQNIVFVPEPVGVVRQEQDGNDAARIMQVDHVGWKRCKHVVFDYERHQVVKRPARKGVCESPAGGDINLHEDIEEARRLEVVVERRDRGTEL